MEASTITLEDGTELSVPASDYPWIQEWSWFYDAESGQVIHIENGHPIYLYHELIKHHREGFGNDEITLSDTALDALYEDNPWYDQLINTYTFCMDQMKGLTVLLPNPYEVLAHALTRVLRHYFEWLQTGNRFVLQMKSDGMELIAEPRSETGPYAIAEVYPVLAGFLFSEWTGTVDESSRPLNYKDLSLGTVSRTFRQYFHQANPHLLPEDAIKTYEDYQLSRIADAIHALVEHYPTPAR